MDSSNVFDLVERCIEKAAQDFLEGKSVDSAALQALMDSVRIVHHTKKIEKEEA